MCGHTGEGKPMKTVRIKYLDHYDMDVKADRVDIMRKAWIENLGWLLGEDETHYFIVKERFFAEGDPVEEYQAIAVLKAQVTEFQELDGPVGQAR